jgi:hypothetical protein
LMVTTRACPAQIDNAEGVAVRVAENHEVRVRGIQIPGKPACPEADEPLDLGFLLGRGVHEQVEVPRGWASTGEALRCKPSARPDPSA